MYDYLIVGSGLFGSVFAHEAKKNNKKCLVIDKRNHIGGNCYTEKIKNISVSKYGPHIFHTSNEKIWKYINQFADFNIIQYKPKVFYKNKFYSFPINLFTLYQVYDVKTPEEAIRKLQEVKIPCENPRNLEDYILSQIGKELYEIFIKGYTTKQWNKDPKDLPSSIIKRIPVRTNFNDNYYFDDYQGFPIDGYEPIFNNLLEGIEVKLSVDYLKEKNNLDKICKNVIYTGPIDKFFNYEYGNLEYRSLRFDQEILEQEDYQGCGGINFTDIDVPYTRIIEHKHFEKYKKNKFTVITKEYPQNYGEPYYPINNNNNNEVYQKYKKISLLDKKYIFGGRLGSYAYLDMDQTIASSLNLSKKIFNV